MVVIKKKILGEDPNKEKQEWDNPNNPEKATDQRDFEQLKRQAKEAERRRENLTDDPQDQEKK
ncbi:MAG TPA: hypothetical protein VNI52_02525 [Sphingobacteriaceae bacterium]|nr:hypothetical protein [Sphingobacteriaceae bacterium]